MSFEIKNDDEQYIKHFCNWNYAAIYYKGSEIN